MNLRRGLIATLLLAQIVGFCPHMDAASSGYEKISDTQELLAAISIFVMTAGFFIGLKEYLNARGLNVLRAKKNKMKKQAATKND